MSSKEKQHQGAGMLQSSTCERYILDVIEESVPGVHYIERHSDDPLCMARF